MPKGKRNQTLDERAAESRERKASDRRTHRSVMMKENHNRHLKKQGSTAFATYEKDFNPENLVIFGLSLLGIDKREIVKQTGVEYRRVNKVVSNFRSCFYGDKAVQAAIRGAQAKLLNVLDAAVEGVMFHVTTFTDPKNYDACKDLLIHAGVYSKQREGDQQVNIAIIAEERKKNLSHSLKTFGLEVKDVPGNGDKPLGTQAQSRMPKSDQSKPD